MNSIKERLAKSSNSSIKALVLAGYGLNCEEETKFAFELAGARADIVHINDLIAGDYSLSDYQILAFPGGFSFGDDTGSGKAYASRLRNHLQEQINEFISEQKLVIGICNGFQVLTQLGFLPGALVHNDGARFIDRWVDLGSDNKSAWLSDIDELSLPIAHGEGKFYIAEDKLQKLKASKQLALQYKRGELCEHQDLPTSPNGSLENIAAVSSEDGRVLGMMPHPERALFFEQLPHWTYLKEKLSREGKEVPVFGPGLKIFENAVNLLKST